MNSKFIKYYCVLLSLAVFSQAIFAVPFADGDGKNLRLRWRSGVIPVAVSSSLFKQVQGMKTEADVLAVVKKSLDSWEKIANVRFELSTVEKQSVNTTGKSGDGVNLITIAPTSENLLLFNGGSEQIAARTQTFYNGKGFITEADIVLNPYQQFSVEGAIDTFDLESTLTHEIGHLLGLEHSPVPGATMFEHQGKNGTYGLANFAPRSLSEIDISGIRDLYGAGNTDVDCCGAVFGKLLTSGGRAARDFQIWIEEADTGRVAAGVLTGADGGFRFSGLAAGKYSVYAQELADGKNAAGRYIGEAEVAKGKTVNFSRKLRSIAKTFGVSNIGFNGQLTELAVPVNGGKSFVIYVGGKNLDIEKLKIGFNSSNLTVVPDSLTKQNFGTEISVITFEVKVNSQILSGEYSFFLRGKNDETAYVTGGLTIDGFVNSWSAYTVSNLD